MSDVLKKNGTPRVRSYRDLVGTWFGNVEVVAKSSVIGHNVTWRCVCHACGITFTRIGATLIPGKTKSCGCVRRQRNSDHVHWRGIGELSGTIYKWYVRSAYRRKIPFNISHQYMWDLFLLQNRKCALTGIVLIFGRRGRDENTASLDRKNSKLPYQEGNVQWVHKHINMMKLDHNQDYFVHLCSLVHKHNSI